MFILLSISPEQPHFNCTKLHSEHPCLILSDRGSAFTLPQTLPVETTIEEYDVIISFRLLTSLRNSSHPDACLDFLERYLCILVAPPCDPESNGLPMQFCEEDCVAYKKLEEEDTCSSTIDLIHSIAGNVQNHDLNEGLKILKSFDCSNVSTYYFFESDGYAETCTGLLSTQSRGKV